MVIVAMLSHQTLSVLIMYAKQVLPVELIPFGITRYTTVLQQQPVFMDFIFMF
jgi:hypothetical protein